MRTPETATGKAFVRDRNYRDAGDGDLCPIDGHGHMFVVGKGRQWCPRREHEMSQSAYANEAGVAQGRGSPTRESLPQGSSAGLTGSQPNLDDIDLDVFAGGI